MLAPSLEISAENGILMVGSPLKASTQISKDSKLIFVSFTALFEECPADFSFLRMQDTPPAGGDTLWVSGYEM